MRSVFSLSFMDVHIVQKIPLFFRFCVFFFHKKIGVAEGDELWLTSSFTVCGVFMKIS